MSTRPRKSAGSARATSSAVVPTSIAMVSSGLTRVAASRAMARLRSWNLTLRAVKVPSLDWTGSAPP